VWWHELIPRGTLDFRLVTLVRAWLSAQSTQPGHGEVWCLSVRSAWDLLLSELGLPPGTPVAMSAANIPDMVRIVESHGLVPYPVDLDPATLSVDPDRLADSLLPGTRVLMVTHLFGSRSDTARIQQICSERSILVVEDCAQAGLDHPPGAGAVCIYSLGPIKSPTALGGGILVARDPVLAARLRERLSGQPLQTTKSYLARCTRMVLIKVLERPIVFGWFTRLVGEWGSDYDALLTRATRGFPGSPSDLIQRLRRRPCAALLRVMGYQRTEVRNSMIQQRIERVQALLECLPPSCIVGRSAPRHQHWVIPIFSRHPGDLVRDLRAAGFDATQKGSSLEAIHPPDGGVAAVCTQEMLARFVYLPNHPALVGAAMERLVEVIQQQEGGA
jgi:perosamine synthetase